MAANDFLLEESLHGGKKDGEGGELGDVEHHHVLLRLLAGALGVRAQARPLYHNLREVRITQLLKMTIFLTFVSKQFSIIMSD